MLRVLAIVDKEGTAIDRLARGVQKHIMNVEYTVLDVHPKRPSPEQLARLEQALPFADIIDYQYFRTAEMLRDRYPELKNKPSILTHYNPYSISESDWKDYEIVVTCNKSIQAELNKIRPTELIPLAVDPYYYSWNEKLPDRNTVIMVANRIEAKKGILPVAQACENLGVNFILVGAISDPAYFQEIQKLQNITFASGISDKDLRELYARSTLHVCNSIDNFESGTMPIMEAMHCGVPVLTRNVGHVPDLFNGSNMEINPHDSEDVEALENIINSLLSDRAKLESMRNAGWQTVKNYTPYRRAVMYSRLYRRLQSDAVPVSAVVPICGDWQTAKKCLVAISQQTYQNIEIVVVDDSDVSLVREVMEFSSMINQPVQYHYTGDHDYGLARARNVGTIHATGEIIVYCDQRQIMDTQAIAEFVKNLVPRTWVFGDKGGGKKDFVENFGAIYRDDIIRAGMFCERVNKYGGMSQEVRARTRAQGISHIYIESAKAKPSGKSSNKHTKKADIIEMKNMLWEMSL